MSTCTATARGQEKENTVKMLHSFPCLQFTWFTCADSISQRVCRSSFRPRSQQKAAIVGLVVNYCRSWRSSNDSLMQGVKCLPPAITASIADANIIFRALALNAASPWPLHLLLPGWGSYCRSRRKSNHSSLSTYVEDTKSRSKVPESEEDLANSGYASPSCFSLCWFAWKADCSVLQESAFPPYGWKLDPWRLKRMALAVAA